MFNIQMLNPVSNKGLAEFPESYHIAAEVAQPDAILVRSFQMHDFKTPASLLVVGRAGVGVNNIPVDRLTQQGIPVLNTPGANTNAVRELVLAGMLLASRNICLAVDYIRHLKGDDEKSFEQQIESDKKRFSGSELRGKTLGVIGLGNIGVQVANAAAGLGMRILGHDPSITVERAWQLSSEVRQARQIEELLSQSDYVTLHVPLLPETRGMVDARRLSRMKRGAVLLNFSRNDIVDEPAVLQALQAGQIAAYVTDFPTLSLKDHPGVICLPHLGASTQEAEENCAVMIARQIRGFLEEGAILNSVNFPAIELVRTPDSHRLALVHRNMPGMVAQISTALAKEKINIISLQNGSRGEMAYTLADISRLPDPGLLPTLSSIEGMIKVRQVY